ncbi:MAG: OstA-like protein [Bacteroidota bacterium]
MVGLPWVLVALLLVGIASAPEVSAQTRTIEILNADEGETVSDSLTGEVSRLIGNVRLRSDTTSLRAARATITDNRRNALLEGSVRIISGDDTLTADRVTYDASTKQAVATGNVRIGAEGGVLFAPTATYNSRDKRATFEGGGRILQDGAELLAPSGTYETERRFAELDGPLTLRDSVTTLTAERGTYDARSRRADVAGTVRLLREADRLDADSLVYFRRTERARAFGDVVLDRPGTEEDSLRRGLLFGNRLIYDGQAETAAMTAEGRAALAVLLDRDSTGTAVDTTLVRALSFSAARETRDSLSVETLTAVREAHLWRDGLGAMADSVSFVRLSPADSLTDAPSRDRLDLFGGTLGLARPTVWVQGSQLVGDSLRILTGALRDSVFATGNAFAGQLDSTLGRLNQLAGERMLGIVREEALRRLTVWPAAQALYHQATAEGLLDGAVRVGADSLVFRFDAESELREAGVFGNVDGTRYGPTIVPADRLPGFAFDPDRQPARDNLLTGWEADWLAKHPDWDRPPPDTVLGAEASADPARLETEAEEPEAEEPNSDSAETPEAPPDATAANE